MKSIPVVNSCRCREGFSDESRTLAHFNYDTNISQLDPILQRMRRLVCRLVYICIHFCYTLGNHDYFLRNTYLSGKNVVAIFFCVVPESFSAQNVQKHEHYKNNLILITSKVKKNSKNFANPLPQYVVNISQWCRFKVNPGFYPPTLSKCIYLGIRNISCILHEVHVYS